MIHQYVYCVVIYNTQIWNGTFYLGISTKQYSNDWQRFFLWGRSIFLQLVVRQTNTNLNNMNIKQKHQMLPELLLLH